MKLKLKTNIHLINKASFLSVLPIVFFLANLYRMLQNGSTLYLASLYTCGVIGLIVLFVPNIKDYSRIILMLFIYGISLIFNWLIVGNTDINSIGVNVLLIGITSLMLIYPNSFRVACFESYLSFIVIYFVIKGLSRYQRILLSTNNYVSILLLIAISFYYIALDREIGRIRLLDLLPALICFSISIWARGRGGILSCGLFLTLLLYIYLRTVTNHNMKRIIILGIVLVLILILFFAYDINPVERFFSLGKWRSKGFDNRSRMNIWNSYFEKMKESPVYILFGAPLDEIIRISLVNNNTHNSFIQLHACSGLLISFCVFCGICYSLYFYIKNKQYVTAAFLFSYCVRAFTDKFIFGQYGMPVFFYLILVPFKKKELDLTTFSNEKYLN